MHLPATLLLLTTLFVLSCGQSDSRPPIKTEKSALHNIIRHPDSADYTHVCYEFYKNKHGNIFEQKEVYDMDSNDNHITVIFYDSSFYLWNEVEGASVEVPITTIVDIESYSWVPSSSYSKDKNQVYYNWKNSDGGRKAIVDGADPRSFRHLADYRWGRDRRFVYYKTDRIEAANASTIEVLSPADTSNPFIDYIRDDRHVFYQGERVPGADPGSFRLVSDTTWDAADNKSRYLQGERINGVP